MARTRGNAHGGAVVTLAVATVLAASVGGVALEAVPSAPTAVALELAVADDRVAVTHRGGPALDVHEVRLELRVDGRPLDHQPPVPFFAARGFRAGPTGPFNAAADPTWSPGETATFRVASSNDPPPEPGDPVTLAVYDGTRRVALARTTASGAE